MGSLWSMKFLGGGSLRNVEPLQCLPHSLYTHAHAASCFLFLPPTFVSSQTKGLIRAQERRAGGGRVHQTQGQMCFVNNKCGGEGRWQSAETDLSPRRTRYDAHSPGQPKDRKLGGERGQAVQGVS